jgi:excisionase family DNA binding protein
MRAGAGATAADEMAAPRATRDVPPSRSCRSGISLQEMHELQLPPADLLSAHDVSRLLGVDTSTVYRMAGDGRLAAVKIGRQWRFPTSRLQLALTHGVPSIAAPPDAVRDAPSAWPDADLLRDVVELAAEALGVMMVVTDMAGRPVTPIVNPCPALAGRTDDPVLLEACAVEWRGLAASLDFEPRFDGGPLGFECARALVRSGPRLIGMVLAGGVAPGAAAAPDAARFPPAGLYALSPDDRRRVLRLLPRVAATISRLSGHVERTPAAAPAAAEGGPR